MRAFTSGTYSPRQARARTKREERTTAPTAFLIEKQHNPNQSCDRITDFGEGLVNLDKDERKGLKQLVETFENLRGHMSTSNMTNNIFII